MLGKWEAGVMRLMHIPILAEDQRILQFLLRSFEISRREQGKFTHGRDEFTWQKPVFHMCALP